MHTHDHTDDSQALRPRSARVEAVDVATMSRAIAAGRPDVLGAAGFASIQRSAGNASAAALVEERSPVLDVVGSGGGQPLEAGLRTDMEARLGHDFGDVRVHTDSAASDSARAVGAHAYTVGSNVVFQRDAYDPGSAAGRTTIAHELTHVVQQRSGPVDGTPTGDGVRVSHPSDRFEQEAASNAERVMAAPAPAVQQVQRDAVDGAGGVDVQREGEEEELQGSFVQREAEEEEEVG
ncbi:MAG: DUF4157 domain-containing protein [Brevundimonas sp.]